MRRIQTNQVSPLDFNRVIRFTIPENAVFLRAFQGERHSTADFADNADQGIVILKASAPSAKSAVQCLVQLLWLRRCRHRQSVVNWFELTPRKG
jgi:hypothetical protein